MIYNKQDQIYIANMGKILTHFPPTTKKEKCLTIVEIKYPIAIIHHLHMHSWCQVSQYKLNQKVFV